MPVEQVCENAISPLPTPLNPLSFLKPLQRLLLLPCGAPLPLFVLVDVDSAPEPVDGERVGEEVSPTIGDKCGGIHVGDLQAVDPANGGDCGNNAAMAWSTSMSVEPCGSAPHRGTLGSPALLTRESNSPEALVPGPDTSSPTSPVPPAAAPFGTAKLGVRQMPAVRSTPAGT